MIALSLTTTQFCVVFNVLEGIHDSWYCEESMDVSSSCAPRKRGRPRKLSSRGWKKKHLAAMIAKDSGFPRNLFFFFL